MSDNLASQFLLREDVTFLNHGSFGACPRPVFETYQAFQLELEREPVDFLGRRLTDTMREPRHVLAAEVGSGPEDLVGVINATTGLNIVAHSLPLQAGDEILTTDHEYSALEKTWAQVCRRTGAEVKVVKVPLPLEEESQFVDTILAGMTERTRVLFLSHITSPTALLFPLEAVIAEARRRNIWTVIDGAHTPGHIDLDLDALGADFYAGNCHKWMMAPKGSAFLHARPEVQGLLTPLVISHGWTEQSKQPGAKGAFGNSPFIDEIEVQGTRDPAAWLTIPSALAFRRENDWRSVARRCSELAEETLERVVERTGLAPLGSSAFRAPQMVAIPIPPCDAPAIHKTLFEKHRIEIPVFKWQDRHIARLSVQGYNVRGQMDSLIAALDELVGLSDQAASAATA
ncbi:aminotransferase class V [Devosia pacifica]|uniref:Aminotransferase class V n=1 Tax=Devosia pacifica TaxID=1335967 RepID=A0A918VSD2_9HYPH|nr:aminotransferase class V-fold PLP-dependent enzyme [Devosia pacifica]GHA18436.1 aminotransferase class V [Devosia pacifica]